MAKLPEYLINNSYLGRNEQVTEDMAKINLVITRDEFVACFNEWIKKPYDDTYDRIKREVLNKYGIEDDDIGGDTGGKQ